MAAIEIERKGEAIEEKCSSKPKMQLRVNLLSLLLIRKWDKKE